MFRAHRAHHQERQIVSIKPLVTVTLCRWPCRVQVHTAFSKDMTPCQSVSVPDILKRRSAFTFKGLEIRDESPFFSDMCSIMY